MLSPLLAARPVSALADARNAVRLDNSNKLQALLREQPKLLTMSFEKQETLLTEAAGAGKHKAVEAVLAQAFQASPAAVERVVNHRNADGGTALTQAILQGHVDVARSLMKHEAVAEGNPALADAISRGRLDVAKLLVALGPQNAKLASTDDSVSEAHSAAANGDAYKLQALLRQNPELLVKRFGNNETVLTAAAGGGDVSTVHAILAQAWISQHASFKDIINHRDGDGNTALAKAAQYGELPVMAALLTYDETDVNLANKHGETPLHHAAMARTPECAELLLSHRSIHPSLPDEEGNTPLHLAIMWQRSATAVKIAAHPEGLPDAPNRNHRTPLATAVDKMDLMVIDALLENDRVDPNRGSGPDGRGLPPLWQALTQWEEDMPPDSPGDPPSTWQDMLVKLVASPRVDAFTSVTHGDIQETPLTFLCKLPRPWDTLESELLTWQVQTIKALLDSRPATGGRQRLDPDARNSAGQTAYQVAQALGRQSLAEALMLWTQADADAGGRTPEPTSS